MAIMLYDLAGAEADRRFSPFCWRTRMALAHKGLEVETVPWRFTEKDKLPQPNGGRVPVIVDGGRVVHDSSAIADYLETHYPERPSLFGGEAARALTVFVQNWTETVVQPALVGLVVLDICRHVAPGGPRLFSPIARGAVRPDARGGGRGPRGAAAGVSRQPGAAAPYRRAPAISRRDAPTYADYIVFGAFQWARAISDFELLAASDPVAAWRGRMLDVFGGLARTTRAYGG